ncbi:MAG: lipopolysaccharide A protein [Oceanospirillaceae bacterium]|nr:lipopolysaccharide A protein [Oceanospirillaceae bacterium]
MIKKYIKIDLSKNQKLFYYLSNVCYLFAPKFIYKHKRNRILKDIKQLVDSEYIDSRVNYYNKKSAKFALNDKFVSIRKFLKSKKKTYYFDLFQVLSVFDYSNKIAFRFGDRTIVPPVPTFVKARPIDGDNENSIILKLDLVRHFIFVDDQLDYQDKKDMLVWRGKVYQDHRRVLMKNFIDNDLLDIGETNTKDITEHWQRPKMSLKQQLQYKFILSIEGNDVASNLKWAMSSNSLVLMTKPKYETWFMEGTLIENYHYVLLKDDYSDVEEKIQYYIKNIDAAKSIIANAHAYIKPFKDSAQEDLIAHLVVEKYFKNQISS